MRAKITVWVRLRFGLWVRVRVGVRVRVRVRVRVMVSDEVCLWPQFDHVSTLIFQEGEN